MLDKETNRIIREINKDLADAVAELERTVQSTNLVLWGRVEELADTIMDLEDRRRKLLRRVVRTADRLNY